MRNACEYKKIGDICDIKTGKLDANAASENGIYPFFTCSKETLAIDSYSYDCECVLIAGNGDLNAKYYKGKFDAYQRTYIITIKPQYKYISTQYLYQFFCKYVEKLRQLSIGGVIKYIKLGNLTDAQIKVPPIEEQEAICSLLDKMNRVIEAKKEQLKELDNLAQAIFYDMFGDILESAPTKFLKDVADYYIGLTYSPTDVAENGTVVLRSSNIQNNVLDFEDTVRVNMVISDKKIVQDGDILMCARNGSARLVGKVARIKNLSEKMSFGAFMTIIRSPYNDFLFQFFLSHYFRNQLTTSKTATINQITTKMLDGIRLNVPSLEQQQAFAEKVKAIEQQKELINQSIREMQTLFDSRMEWWFGE